MRLCPGVTAQQERLSELRLMSRRGKEDVRFSELRDSAVPTLNKKDSRYATTKTNSSDRR